MVDARLEIDGRSLTETADRLARSYLGAGKEALADTTKQLEREIEGLIQANVPEIGRAHV